MSHYLNVMGKYFGFPQCCTSQYEKDKSLNEFRKLDGTGFLPCLTCHTEKTEAELLESIQQNRICKTPFPHEPLIDEMVLDIFESEQFTFEEKAKFAMQLQEKYFEEAFHTLEVALPEMALKVEQAIWQEELKQEQHGHVVFE